MAITICGSCIELGTNPMCNTPTGILFEGAICASGGFSQLPWWTGSSFGYVSGGDGPVGVNNVIQKYPYASDGNAADVGDLTVTRYDSSGQSSSVSGYTTAGLCSPVGKSDVIDKFPFASDGNATDVGDTAFCQDSCGTAGASSDTHGYASGHVPFAPVGVWQRIQKFPFASDANATCIGVITPSAAEYHAAGQNSATNGYHSGGFGTVTIIEKYPFATDSNSTIVGSLTNGRRHASGSSSDVSGYTVGGGYPFRNIIDKFPFAADANATDVGDIITGDYKGSGSQSTVSGYKAGYFVNCAQIEKFPFATDSNSTDVGDLAGAGTNNGQGAGQQV